MVKFSDRVKKQHRGSDDLMNLKSLMQSDFGMDLVNGVLYINLHDIRDFLDSNLVTI